MPHHAARPRQGSCFSALRRDGSRSYLRSTGCHRQSGGLFDVLRGVVVPVVPVPRTRARPGPDVQGFGPVLVPQAEHTWEVGSNRPTGRTCRPYRRALYSSMRDERRPAGVVHGLGQPGAGESFHRQVLHGDRLVFADQLGGELVVELAARIGHLRVRPGDLEPGLVPVLGALLLAGQLPLRPLQFLLRPAQKPRASRSSGRPTGPRSGSDPGRCRPPAPARAGCPARSRRRTEAKYRPAASRITVTLDGSDGSVRDQRTGTSPIFGSRSFPPGYLEPGVGGEPDRLPVVLRDRNRGGPIFGPFRVPLTRRRSSGRRRSGPPAPAAGPPPTPRPATPAPGWPSPRSAGPTAPRRRHTAARPRGLLPGAQPVVEHHPRAPERPRQRNALTRRRVEAEAVPKLHESIIVWLHARS